MFISATSIMHNEVLLNFYEQNIEHEYINVLFNYIIVMRYDTSLKIK